MKLNGKVALITGAGSGIGRASALLFANEGAKIAVVDRDKETAQAAADEINKNSGAAIALHADVSQASDNEEMVKATVEAFGALDILFLNAGIVAQKLVHEMSVEEWDRVIGINLRSLFLGCHFGLPELLKKGGVIVFTTSAAGTTGAAGQAHYSASKAAAINMAKSLAIDYAPHNIRVNCLCPGPVVTNIQKGVMEDTPEAAARVKKWIEAVVPMQRMGSSEELARGALFLCSDDSSFMTGHNLIVDGGQTSGFNAPITR